LVEILIFLGGDYSRLSIIINNYRAFVGYRKQMRTRNEFMDENLLTAQLKINLLSLVDSGNFNENLFIVLFTFFFAKKWRNNLFLSFYANGLEIKPRPYLFDHFQHESHNTDFLTVKKVVQS